MDPAVTGDSAPWSLQSTASPLSLDHMRLTFTTEEEFGSQRELRTCFAGVRAMFLWDSDTSQIGKGRGRRRSCYIEMYWMRFVSKTSMDLK